MITPIELQSKTFKTGIGYDKKDVDSFLKDVLKAYEITYKESMELKDKLNTLNEGINYYKSIEKTLQKALVLAEQTAEETKETARQKAKAIEEEAKVKAKLMVVDATNELAHIQQQTIQLIRQYEAYKAQFKHLAASQCELLDSESFNIHVADLDVFSSRSYSDLEPEDCVSEAENIASVFTSQKDIDASEEVASTEEGFEFFSLED